MVVLFLQVFAESVPVFTFLFNADNLSPLICSRYPKAINYDDIR